MAVQKMTFYENEFSGKDAGVSHKLGMNPFTTVTDNRRITALLHNEGWQVNHKRVERVWRREGLKVPARQPKRGRLWLNDGSCLRLKPEFPNHVWSYDFMFERTHDGRAFRILNVIDEFTRESLAVRVERHLG